MSIRRHHTTTPALQYSSHALENSASSSITTISLPLAGIGDSCGWLYSLCCHAPGGNERIEWKSTNPCPGMRPMRSESEELHAKRSTIERPRPCPARLSSCGTSDLVDFAENVPLLILRNAGSLSQTSMRLNAAAAAADHDSALRSVAHRVGYEVQHDFLPSRMKSLRTQALLDTTARRSPFHAQIP